MAKFNVESLISSNTVDGNVDYTKINEALEKQNKDIVKKEVSKEAKKYDKDTVIKEFLIEQEFKSLDEFTAFKKNGSTVDSETVKRVEKERDDFKLQYEQLVPLKGEISAYKNRAVLRSKGTFTPDELEFMEYKINKIEGESFEEKLTVYTEANPNAFTTIPQPKNIITTGSRTGVLPADGKLGWEKILEDKGKL